MWNQKERGDAERGIGLTARSIGGSGKDITEWEHLEEHSALLRTGVRRGESGFVVSGTPRCRRGSVEGACMIERASRAPG